MGRSLFLALSLLALGGCPSDEGGAEGPAPAADPDEAAAAPVDVEELLAHPLGELPDAAALSRALPGAWTEEPCDAPHALAACRVLRLRRPGLDATVVVVPDKPVMVASLEVERRDVLLARGIHVGASREEVVRRLGSDRLFELLGQPGIQGTGDEITLQSREDPSSLRLFFDEEGRLEQIRYDGYVD